MTREERLKDIASQLYEANEDEREIKKRREELRQEFFRLYDDGLKGRDHILPVRTIEVPQAFFEKTGMSKEEFAETRYPGWTVEFCEKNIITGDTTFIFKKDPKYIPGVVEADRLLRVSKEVIEYNPDIDWKTLQAERPDLCQKIARYEIVPQIDEEAFQKLVAEHPEELVTMERHLRVRPPALRATAKVVKDDGQGTK